MGECARTPHTTPTVRTRRNTPAKPRARAHRLLAPTHTCTHLTSQTHTCARTPPVAHSHSHTHTNAHTHTHTHTPTHTHTTNTPKHPKSDCMCMYCMCVVGGITHIDWACVRVCASRPCRHSPATAPRCAEGRSRKLSTCSAPPTRERHAPARPRRGRRAATCSRVELPALRGSRCNQIERKGVDRGSPLAAGCRRGGPLPPRTWRGGPLLRMCACVCVCVWYGKQLY